MVNQNTNIFIEENAIEMFVLKFSCINVLLLLLVIGDE